MAALGPPLDLSGPLDLRPRPGDERGFGFGGEQGAVVPLRASSRPVSQKPRMLDMYGQPVPAGVSVAPASAFDPQYDPTLEAHEQPLVATRADGRGVQVEDVMRAAGSYALSGAGVFQKLVDLAADKILPLLARGQVGIADREVTHIVSLLKPDQVRLLDRHCQLVAQQGLHSAVDLDGKRAPLGCFGTYRTDMRIVLGAFGHELMGRAIAQGVDAMTAEGMAANLSTKFAQALQARATGRLALTGGRPHRRRTGHGRRRTGHGRRRTGHGRRRTGHGRRRTRRGRRRTRRGRRR